mgnify:CR=1 FL=1
MSEHCAEHAGTKKTGAIMRLPEVTGVRIVREHLHLPAPFQYVLLLAEDAKHLSVALHARAA